MLFHTVKPIHLLPSMSCRKKQRWKQIFLRLELLIMSAEEAVRDEECQYIRLTPKAIAWKKLLCDEQLNAISNQGSMRFSPPNGECYKSCCRKSHFFSLVNQPFYSEHDFQYFLSAFVFSFSSVIVKISSYLSTRKAGEEFSPFIFIFPVLL